MPRNRLSAAGWRLVLTVACATLSVCCGTLPGGRRWGDDVTLLPSGERLLRAARDAATDPWTWVPVAGAVTLSVAGWDENLVEWGREQNPVYGSAEHAEEMGHVMRAIAQDAWLASLIAAPSGDEAGPWLRSKVKAYAVEWSAVWATDEITTALKHAVDRDRPDGSDTNSFPSSGASNTSVMAMLARRNLTSIELREGTRMATDVGLALVESLEAWSRVEAGKHHVTDVLVGTALGNFMGRFVHDAFLGLPDDVQLITRIVPGEEAAVGFAVRF